MTVTQYTTSQLADAAVSPQPGDLWLNAAPDDSAPDGNWQLWRAELLEYRGADGDPELGGWVIVAETTSRMLRPGVCWGFDAYGKSAMFN